MGDHPRFRRLHNSRWQPIKSIFFRHNSDRIKIVRHTKLNWKNPICSSRTTCPESVSRNIADRFRQIYDINVQLTSLTFMIINRLTRRRERLVSHVGHDIFQSVICQGVCAIARRPVRGNHRRGKNQHIISCMQQRKLPIPR